MCQNQDPVFFDVPTEFEVDPGSISFREYRRPVQNDEAVEKALFTKRPFPQGYNLWHSRRLPLFVSKAAGKRIVCPWCGFHYSIRGLQLDHIIPAKKYIRYLTLTDARLGMQNLEDKEIATRGEVLRGNDFRVQSINDQYNHTKNVILCCVDCNRRNSDKLKTSAEFDAAIDHYADGDEVVEKLEKARELTGKIRDLIDQEEDSFIGDYIENGIGSSHISKRQRAIEANLRVKAPTMTANGKRRWDYSKEEIDWPNLKAALIRLILSEHHDAMVQCFYKRRPKWTLSSEDLIKEQLSANPVHAVGRVCFYCLGIVGERGFDVDHIKSLHATGPTTLMQIGRSNHLPVCQKCNAAKGANPLTFIFLADQLAKRQEQKVLGVEDCLEIVIDESPEDLYVMEGKTYLAQVVDDEPPLVDGDQALIHSADKAPITDRSKDYLKQFDDADNVEDSFAAYSLEEAIKIRNHLLAGFIA